MAAAVAAAKEYDFDGAVARLRPVSALADYRFKHLADSAAQGIKKIQKLREQAIVSMNQALLRAKDAMSGGNQQDVVRILESVPPQMLNEDGKKILARVKTHTDELSSLDRELRAAVKNKDWPQVGGLIDQVLDLSPREEQYRRLADQVAEKLIAHARKQLENGRYAAAATRLSCVPRAAQNEKFHTLSEQVENVNWLVSQFDAEPYVSPVLGRLAVRFSKEVPKDSSAQELVKKLATHLKKAPRTKRMHLPVWKAQRDSWLGGEAGMLGLPIGVSISDAQELRSAAGRFNVAIGLAIQGLGKGRIEQDFLIKKKGLLGSIGKRKTTTCWGLDIGSSSVKAVCLRVSGDEVEVIDCFFAEYSVPVCRPGSEESELELVRPAIDQFVEEKEIGNTPVWVNLSSSHVVSRFVRLPPLKDKEAHKLLTREIEQKVPIPMDELVTVKWMENLGDDDIHGRPAVAVAARRRIVQDRMDLLDQLNLTVAGIQSDNLALVNFAAHEFAELWGDDASHSQAVAVEKAVASEDEELADDGIQQDGIRTRTVALVDCGASVTNLVLVSGEGHWSWTFETGGEDLTGCIAHSTKKNLADAEQLKRNPAALELPASQYEAVEQRMEEVRIRMQTVFADARRQNARFHVVQTWCMGGAALAHGWMRRMLMQDGDHNGQQSAVSS